MSFFVKSQAPAIMALSMNICFFIPKIQRTAGDIQTFLTLEVETVRIGGTKCTREEGMRPATYKSNLQPLISWCTKKNVLVQLVK